MYLVALINKDKCVGCRACVQTCPEPNAIMYIAGKKKSNVISIKCKGCGICEIKCPKKAIVLVQEK